MAADDDTSDTEIDTSTNSSSSSDTQNDFEVQISGDTPHREDATAADPVAEETSSTPTDSQDD